MKYLKVKSALGICSINVLRFLAFFLLTSQVYGQQKDFYVLDMVHNNPGEPLTETRYNDPAFLNEMGYTGQVMNDFTFVHAAITYDHINRNIFPEGSKEREWVLKAADRVRKNIKVAHAAGIKVYYFTDIIVLPKNLVSLYKDEILDENGKISFERPKTVEIHRKMLREVFDTFPELDGLVIRTGETYLNNVPHHTGNNPITNGVESHIKLINLLREEVAVKRNKKVFYRTWSFGGMHDDKRYYLDVTDQIEPHQNLTFAIKHTQGDYHRTHDFNPTISVGNHSQIIEVQCQREYEGKGAFPNYIAKGVIKGFEEYSGNSPQEGYQSLEDIKNTPQLTGVWTWSRGGGWVGPYISNEFWIHLNAYVISHWGADTAKTEEQIFNDFMDEAGIKGNSREAFRQLCLLSAQAVLRGHATAELPADKGLVWWTRDQFLGGIHAANAENEIVLGGTPLYKAFDRWYKSGELDAALAEKYKAVRIWEQIVKLSKEVKLPNARDEQYLKVSAQYGLLLHKIIAEGWHIMALGFEGNQTGNFDKKKIAGCIKKYDKYWKQFSQLKAKNPDCATLYKPYAFRYEPPDYQAETGMHASINKYRNLK